MIPPEIIKPCFIKPEFIEMVESMPDIDIKAFMTAMSESPAVSFKLNRRKTTNVSELGYGMPEEVSWCRSGFYLDSRPKFTLNPLLHAGVFYVQDASSMIYETITSQLIEDYGLTATPLVLDMCAAPGGKTTSIINALADGSFVVANEVMPQRAKILRENLLKWGYPDIMVTNSSVRTIASVGEVFDLVAVDAPCSGEGMMRKDEEAVRQWTPGLVEKCAALQQSILAEAVNALRPGGFMIYSTCTFNRHENEENVKWLIAEHGLEPVQIRVPDDNGIGGAIGAELPAMRFMPHLTRGEGLFAAVLRKPGDAQPANRKKAIAAISDKTHVILDGIPTVSLKGKVELPASEWVLSTRFPRDKFPTAELDMETAQRYLRHEAIRLDPNCPRGFIVVTYGGHPLGFVKNIGNRANNLFPPEWRIRTL